MKENSISGWKLNLHKDDIKRNWRKLNCFKHEIITRTVLTLGPLSEEELEETCNNKKNKIKKKLDVKFEHKMFVSPLQKVFHVVPSKFLSGIGTFCLIMLSLALFAVSQHLRLYLMIQKMMIYNSKKRYAIQNTCKKKVKEVNIGRYQDWNVL